MKRFGTQSQFRSVIQWETPAPGQLFQRWTADGDEIKNSSKLIVGPGQGCIFVYDGKVQAVFQDEGLYELETENIPFLTTLSKLMQGFTSEHKVGLYFFKTTRVLNQKWGTPSAITYQDPKYNFPVGLRLFGNLSFHITHPGEFFAQVIGTAESYTTEDFRALMSGRISQPLADYLAGMAHSYADIDRERNEIAAEVRQRLAAEFITLGFALEDFRIEGTSFDEATMKRINRITDMNAEAQAAAAAGLSYAQLAQLDALKAAAANPSGGAGLGMGLGVGAGLGQVLAGQGPQGPGDPMAKLAQLKKMADACLIDPTEYAAKKKEILDQL